MAELDIGLHCCLAECKQLDFLPFKCDGCSLIFCLEHKGRTAHACSDVNYRDITKPVAERPIYRCTFEVCTGTELVPVRCASCGKLYCLSHRLPEDHNCSSLKTEGKKSTDVKMPSVFPMKSMAPSVHPKKKTLNLKNQKMAAKVALMKLKQKASGDKGIPVENRVYFSVKTPKNDNLSIFLSGKWVFGKLIDEIAKTTNLTNTNNLSLKNRLILRNLDSGENLDPSITISDAITSDLVFSGSRLELYVEDC